MVDAEIAGQHAPGLEQNAWPGLDPIEQQVRRHRVAAGHDRPNVKIVDRTHAIDSGQSLTDSLELDPRGNAVQQHHRRFLQYPSVERRIRPLTSIDSSGSTTVYPVR